MYTLKIIELRKKEGISCSRDKISIPSVKEPVEILKSLYMRKIDKSRRFLDHLRKKNSSYMTLSRADKIITTLSFSPTLTVQEML